LFEIPSTKLKIVSVQKIDSLAFVEKAWNSSNVHVVIFTGIYQNIGNFFKSVIKR